MLFDETDLQPAWTQNMTWRDKETRGQTGQTSDTCWDTRWTSSRTFTQKTSSNKSIINTWLLLIKQMVEMLRCCWFPLMWVSLLQTALCWLVMSTYKYFSWVHCIVSTDSVNAVKCFTVKGACWSFTVVKLQQTQSKTAGLWQTQDQLRLLWMFNSLWVRGHINMNTLHLLSADWRSALLLYMLYPKNTSLILKLIVEHLQCEAWQPVSLNEKRHMNQLKPGRVHLPIMPLCLCL